MTQPDIDNSHLENLMAQAFENEQKNHEFFSVLFSSDVFILGGSGDIVPETLEAGTSVNIEQWHMEDGTPFIPVFTSVAELLDTVENKESNYLALNAGSLFEMVRGTDVVINPMSDHGFHIDPEGMDGILDHFLDHHAHAIEADTSVLVGQPDVDVGHLKHALSDYFRRDGRVEYAALAVMSRQDVAESSILIGVAFVDDKISTEVFKAAGAAASPHAPKGYNLDMMALSGAAEEGSVEAYLERDGDRFFTR